MKAISEKVKKRWVSPISKYHKREGTHILEAIGKILHTFYIPASYIPASWTEVSFEFSERLTTNQLVRKKMKEVVAYTLIAYSQEHPLHRQ